MVKIGLLTFQRSPNYGAVLQAYALQQTIEKLGVNCEILDLLRPTHRDYKNTKRNASLESDRKIVAMKRPSLSEKLNVLIRDAADKVLFMQKHRRFRQFDHAYFKISPQSYCSSDELYSASLDFDGYITGSDQVWNPTFPWNPEPYFLTFAPAGIPRIAYAPSFGVGELDKAFHSLYRRWLTGITHMSIRETQGAKIIRQLTGRDAEVVLDPTFLLSKNEWKALARNPNIKAPYIFCYSVGDTPGLVELCDHVQKVTGYRIYKIGSLRDVLNPHLKSVMGAGPQEFLGYINKAAIVITNSFHGTVLSMNMQRPFFTVASRVMGKHSRNTRLFSVLKLLSATDRLYKHGDFFPATSMFEMVNDVISNTLAVEREASVTYLKSAICGN